VVVILCDDFQVCLCKGGPARARVGRRSVTRTRTGTRQAEKCVRPVMQKVPTITVIQIKVDMDALQFRVVATFS